MQGELGPFRSIVKALGAPSGSEYVCERNLSYQENGHLAHVCSRKMCCASTVNNRVAGILVQNLREQLFGVRRLS
jgi:hypothetical protein